MLHSRLASLRSERFEEHSESKELQIPVAALLVNGDSRTALQQKVRNLPATGKTES
jgi:hypothetical protein